jgi:magnesium transporter
MLVLTDLQPDLIAEHLRSDQFFWLDLTSPTPDELRKVGELLELHPVAVEDTLEFGQRPKLDTYENHLLLVYYSARLDDDATAVPIEVHVYLSGAFVMTVRRTRCAALEQLHEDLQRQPTDDEGFLVYKILDTLTDAYYPVVEGLEDRIDALEGEVLDHARKAQLREIYRLRQAIREQLRIAAAQRDQWPAAADAIRVLPGLRQGTVEYLRDVGDHLAQVAGELTRQIDDIHALTGTYFNANSDRLNAVATRLTIVGTIFVTWTVFTGFFGQNFGWLVNHIASAETFWGLGVGLPVGVTAIAGLVLWVKRRDLF